MDLRTVFDTQKTAWSKDRNASYAVRCDRLDRLAAGLRHRANDVVEAVDADFGGRTTALTKAADLMGPISWTKSVKQQLRGWMRPERRRLEFPFWLLGYKGEIQYRSKGVVGIMGPSNVPVGLCLYPLIDVLAAGNRAMIKPSEMTPNAAAVLAEIITASFSPDEVAVFTGDADVSRAFAALPFDHLVFTGGARTARHILRAAAENVTPVTLELGGKAPVFVSRSADLAATAQKIIAGKLVNAGQVCVSPDYALVPREGLSNFVEACRNHAATLYPTYVDNPDYTGQVKPEESARLSALLEEARSLGSEVLSLAAPGEAVEGRRFTPHIVIDPPEDTQLMRHETFGPILVVKPYDTLADAVDCIQRRDAPLALYYFGRDGSERQKLLDQTASGNVAINDVVSNTIMQNLPFGGVGESGMGRYYGRDGFKTFSNSRSILTRGFIDALKPMSTPPYTPALLRFIDRAIRKV